MAKKKAVKRTRRANNEGSIFQRSDGRWGGALTMGYDENGKIIRKTIYGKSRAEVVKKLSEISGRIKSNSYDLVEQNNLESLMFEYLMTFKKNAVSSRTFEGDIRNFKLHIDPSNMLFEMNENPKVIQQLLGHRDVKTTITVYNSVDSEYVRQTTEKFNEKVKEEQMLIDQNIREEVIEERKEKLVKDMTDEEFDDMLQKLMEERQERKRKKQSYMEM